MNDVRESRLILLAGINNAILRLETQPPSDRAADIKAVAFDIRNLEGALESEVLTTSSPSLSSAAPTLTSATTTAPITTTSMTAVPTTTTSSSSVTLSPTLSQNPTGGAAAVSVDITHIAQLLKTDQLQAATGELNNLLTQVIMSHLVQSQQPQQQQQQPQQQLLHQQGKPIQSQTQLRQQVLPQIQPLQQPQPGQQQQPPQLGLPIANAGASQTVQENVKVTLDGSASHSHPNNGATIVAYQWTQLPLGVPVVLSGTNTPTPTFTAPVVHTDTVLGFSLRVMDNHVAVSTNPAIVYIMVKHNPNIGPTVGSSNNQPLRQQQSLQPIVPNNILPIPSQPNVHPPGIGSFRP